jgi:predicted dehydrogenase
MLAAAALFPSCISSFASNKKDALKIGIIGTGDRGQGLSVKMQKFPKLQVHAICDVLPFRLEEAKKKNPDALTYTNYKKLLENKDLDAIIVATPLSSHYQIASDALDTGRHVYLEKTMVFHDHEVFKLIDKVKATGKVLQVGHQYRSTPLYFRVAEMIQSGDLGEILNIYIQWNRNGNWRRKVPDPAYERQVNWRMYREYSGGLTAELLSHQLDFVNYIFDAHPLSVMGAGGIDYWEDGRETFDNVNLLYEYPEGLKVNAISMTSNAQDGYRIVFRGSKATIEMSMEDAWLIPEGQKKKMTGNVDGVSGATVKYAQQHGKPVLDPSTNPDWTNTDYALYAFYQSVMDNNLPYSNVYNGGVTALCVRMGLDAMINNEKVRWKPEYKAVIQPS